MLLSSTVTIGVRCLLRILRGLSEMLRCDLQVVLRRDRP